MLLSPLRTVAVLGSVDLLWRCSEMMEFIQLKHNQTFRENYLNPLLEKGISEMTLPNTPKRKFQKYVVKEELL